MSNIDNCVFMAKRMLTDSIWKSANIEGLGTSYPNTECILNNIPVNTTWEESTFITNMNRAWRFILDNISVKNDLLFLRSLHEVCCKMLARNAGELRTGTVRIGGCTYIPDIPNIEDVYNALNSIDNIKDPINKAMVMFCYLTRSQLFWDGNKRMAQLMTNKILIENGVGILNFKIDLIPDLINHLVKFYESNDAYELCSFIHNNCIDLV
jgi:Fic family protein